MIRLLLLGLLLSIGSVTTANAQSEDASEAFHYRDGAYGYRAEAQLMDSLAILEMMEEISPAEVQQEQRKFKKAKKEKRRQKKEKLRKRRKKKKKGKKG